MLFKRLRRETPPTLVNRIPVECEVCRSTDIVRIPRSMLDREGDIQRRYHCGNCKKDTLVANCSALNDHSYCERAADGSSRPLKLNAAEEVSSQYERKIKVLEDQLKLIDGDIDHSHRIADAQEAELMRAKLGVADLRNLDAVAVKHARVLTLLNELHRTHYSKELVLTETEHERDQLRRRLEAAQARFSEMELLFQGESNNAKDALDSVLVENQELKQRVLSLEGELVSIAEEKAEAVKKRNAALNKIKVLAEESALEIGELKSQLNVAHTMLKQTEVNAEREQLRFMKKVRDLESQLSEPQPEEPAGQGGRESVAAHSVVERSNSHDRESQPLTTIASNEPRLDSASARVSAALPPLAIEKYKDGVKYLKGDGVTKSEKTAVAYFEQAADLGHPSAQTNLGILKFKGPLALRDLSESIYWLSLSAAQGHQKAIALLPEVEAANREAEVRNAAM